MNTTENILEHRERYRLGWNTRTGSEMLTMENKVVDNEERRKWKGFTIDFPRTIIWGYY